MPSPEFQELAHKIAEENKPTFDALIEYEQTKRLRTKERVNFTIDKNVTAKFRKFCKEHGYSMSAKVEQALRELMKQ